MVWGAQRLQPDAARVHKRIAVTALRPWVWSRICAERVGVSGMAQFPAVIQLSSLSGSDGFQILGAAASNYSGISVSSAGDVNGDGFADLLVGAPGASVNGSYSGASYVVFGKASGFSATLALSALNGTNGF